MREKLSFHLHLKLLAVSLVEEGLADRILDTEEVDLVIRMKHQPSRNIKPCKAWFLAHHRLHLAALEMTLTIRSSTGPSISVVRSGELDLGQILKIMTNKMKYNWVVLINRDNSFIIVALLG